jgi:hypothetical protein
MNKVTEILTAVRELSPGERRQLIIELSALESLDLSGATKPGGPYAALRALSGTIHSDHQDISTEKYPHVAEAAGSRS